MSDCCSTNTSPAKKTRLACPVNNQDYIEVPYRTILYHVKQPWLYEVAEQKYYFCTDPHCDVVYFAEDGTRIKKSELRSKLGIKEQSNNATLCYCFGITRQAALDDKGLKDYVIHKTRASLCSCEILNPSGRCCLKDFPK